MDVLELLVEHPPGMSLSEICRRRGGITSRLVDLSSAMVGHIRGAPAQAGVNATMFFGGVSGSAVANTATVGSAIIPPMVKEGYDRAFSAALIATSGTLGMLMPTSITLIIFALTANVSIARLLLAGLIPGVLTAIMLCIYVYFYLVRKGYVAGAAFSFRRLLRAFGGAIVLGVTPGIIVTGIVGGVFTPTEAGAVAVVYAALIGLFCYRELNMRALLDCAVHTSVITGLVLFLIFTSFAFSWVITLERVPELFSNYLLGGTTRPIVIFVLMNLLLLAIGTFLDPMPTILITVPIFLPIAVQYGIDPIHFGIIFAMNMALAQVSPPAGSVLSTACGIARVSMVQVHTAASAFHGRAADKLDPPNSCAIPGTVPARFAHWQAAEVSRNQRWISTMTVTLLEVSASIARSSSIRRSKKLPPTPKPMTVFEKR